MLTPPAPYAWRGSSPSRVAASTHGDRIENRMDPVSQHIIWGNYRVTARPAAGSNAWTRGLTWGALKTTADAMSSGGHSADNIVWRTSNRRQHRVGAPTLRRNIVWSTAGATNGTIVWSTAAGDDNIVWSTLADHDNIVWSTALAQNVSGDGLRRNATAVG